VKEPCILNEIRASSPRRQICRDKEFKGKSAGVHISVDSSANQSTGIPEARTPADILKPVQKFSDGIRFSLMVSGAAKVGTKELRRLSLA